jgi:hypothetical protein
MRNTSSAEAQPSDLAACTRRDILTGAAAATAASLLAVAGCAGTRPPTQSAANGAVSPAASMRNRRRLGSLEVSALGLG